MYLPGEAGSRIISNYVHNGGNNPAASIATGKQHLILIAIDNYLQWPSLQGPVSEALQLKKVLATRYHFDEIIELYNQQATRQAIRTCLLRFQVGRENQLEVNDSLFIYFSGHGYSFKEEDWNGYWIPYNGGNDMDARAYWISNSELTGLINKIKANHILIVSDSCFASTLLDEGRSILNASGVGKYWQENYDKCSRKVLTSGGLERVPGQSVFIQLLIDELNRNQKPWIDMADIYRAMEWKVFEKTGNHPGYGNLKYTDFNTSGSYILFALPSLPP